MAKQAKSKKTDWSFTGAFTVLGLGIGFFANEIVGGLLVGLGIGLLLTSYLRYKNT